MAACSVAGQSVGFSVFVFDPPGLMALAGPLCGGLGCRTGLPAGLPAWVAGPVAREAGGVGRQRTARNNTPPNPRKQIKKPETEYRARFALGPR